MQSMQFHPKTGDWGTSIEYLEGFGVAPCWVELKFAGNGVLPNTEGDLLREEVARLWAEHPTGAEFLKAGESLAQAREELAEVDRQIERASMDLRHITVAGGKGAATKIAQAKARVEQAAVPREALLTGIAALEARHAELRANAVSAFERVVAQAKANTVEKLQAKFIQTCEAITEKISGLLVDCMQAKVQIDRLNRSLLLNLVRENSSVLTQYASADSGMGQAIARRLSGELPIEVKPKTKPGIAHTVTSPAGQPAVRLPIA